LEGFQFKKAMFNGGELLAPTIHSQPHVLTCTHMKHPSEHPTMSNRATVTFHTSPEVKARLDVLANRTRRSKSFLTNEAVERYLAEEEDFIQDVELAIAEADAGQVVDHEVAAAYLRSLGTDSPLPMPRTKHL
jgi:predicted transcriptional regulator